MEASRFGLGFSHFQAAPFAPATLHRHYIFQSAISSLSSLTSLPLLPSPRPLLSAPRIPSPVFAMLPLSGISAHSTSGPPAASTRQTLPAPSSSLPPFARPPLTPSTLFAGRARRVDPSAVTSVTRVGTAVFRAPLLPQHHPQQLTPRTMFGRVYSTVRGPSSAPRQIAGGATGYSDGIPRPLSPQELPAKYKGAEIKVRLVIIALPIAIVTSWVLYQRCEYVVYPKRVDTNVACVEVVNGVERKRLANKEDVKETRLGKL